MLTLLKDIIFSVSTKLNGKYLSWLKSSVQIGKVFGCFVVLSKGLTSGLAVGPIIGLTVGPVGGITELVHMINVPSLCINLVVYQCMYNNYVSK